MDDYFDKKQQVTSGLPGYKTNSPVTNNDSIINCCLDWFKFVFPYSQEDKYLFDTSYNKIYEDYKENFPDMPDEEIFKEIDNSYPGLKPGIHYIKNNNDSCEDDVSGLWSLNKIKTALIHWFRLNKFIHESSVQTIKKLSGFKYIQEFCPGITFLAEGPEMKYTGLDGKTHNYKTCAIELSGRGCRKVEELGVNLINVLEYLYKIPGCHATRIDSAVDLINDNEITFRWLKEKIFNSLFISSFKKVRYDNPMDIKSSDTGLKYLEAYGESIVFGSRSSTSRLNIYDKLEERINNAGFQVEAKSWIRFEIQFFDEKSNNLAKKLLSCIDTNNYQNLAMSLLYDHLDIKVNKNLFNDTAYRPSKTCTWPTDPIWADFIGQVSKIKIRNQAELEADFCKTRDWFERSAYKTLAMLNILYDEDVLTEIDSLNREIEILEEFDDSQLNVINQYREKRYGKTEELSFKYIQNRLKKLIQRRDMLIKIAKNKEENLNAGV